MNYLAHITDQFYTSDGLIESIYRISDCNSVSDAIKTIIQKCYNNRLDIKDAYFNSDINVVHFDLSKETGVMSSVHMYFETK